jgi:hypothetical protein
MVSDQEGGTASRALTVRSRSGDAPRAQCRAMSPLRAEGTTVLRVPPGLAGPDVDELRRLVRTEVRRNDVRRLELDLRATTASRRLAPVVLEARRAAEAAGKAFLLHAPAHPAARAELERRLVG